MKHKLNRYNIIILGIIIVIIILVIASYFIKEGILPPLPPVESLPPAPPGS